MDTFPARLRRVRYVLALSLLRSYAVLIFLRKNLPPSKQTPPIVNKATVLASGTPVAAENENCDDAEGSCVVKFHVPAVGVKPFPETVPVPATVTAPLPGPPVWVTIKEIVKSNLKYRRTKN